MLWWIPFIVGSVVVGGAAAAVQWFAEVQGPRPLPPERCLICDAVVNAALSGAYRCGRCGFDTAWGEEAPFRARVAALRVLRDLRDEVATQIHDHRSHRLLVDSWLTEERPGLPQPGLPKEPIRDLIRDAPELLERSTLYRSTSDPEAEAATQGLARTLVAPEFIWDDHSVKAQQREALRRLAVWEQALATFQRLLAGRLDAEMRGCLRT